MIPCSTCNGDGVVYYEPPGWWHGSGVFTEEHTCSSCGGDGQVVAEPAEGPEPEPDEDTQQAWAQVDIDRAVGRSAFPAAVSW